jgi:predicted ester cyclase
MSVEENKALIRRMYELINQKEPYYELLTPDFVVHGTSSDMSLEQNKRFDAMLLTGFAEFKTTLHNMIAEADKVAFQVNIKMTHTGPFMGAAPTGKKIEITNTYIVKIFNNKVSEWWGTAEFTRVMQELGVTPSTPQK